MKICYLASAKSTHTWKWIKSFVDKGHEVHLVSFESFGGNSIKNIKLYRLKEFRPQIRGISFLINLISSVIQVRRLTKRIKPDILYAHYITGYGFLGALSGFHPFMVTAMGSDILVEPEQHSFIKIITKFTLRKADLVTCHGGILLERIVELGVKREKVQAINLWVDPQKFSPLPLHRRSSIRKQLGLFDSPTVISTRDFKPVYDIETLVRAIPLVLEKVPDAKFVIAGQGVEGDHGSYLKELAKSLGVLDSARFVGWIPHDEIPGYLASADIYVSTSLSDGAPVSTLEAMACELPVVVTESGEHRRWVKDGINGFVVPMRSPEALASKISYLLENENDRSKFGKANRPVARQIADYEKEVEKQEKLFEELTAKGK